MLGSMNRGVALKNVPTAAWWFLTVAFVAVVAAFVVLGVTGTDAAEFRGFLNVVSNLAGLLLGGGAVVYSGAAAKNSQQAAEQTNGALDERIEAGVRAALEAQRAADVLPGGELRRGRMEGR
jgi:hypothetical protein